MKLSQLSQKLKSDSRDEFSVRAAELEKQGKKIIHFEIGEPDFDTPKHVVEAAIESLRQGDTHYDEAAGRVDLRAAIAQSVKDDLGFLPSNDQIIVGPSPLLIYFLMQCVANKGDEVLVQEPAYARFFSLLNILDLKPVVIPIHGESGFHMKLDDLEKKITGKTKLLVINSPHNPTGMMLNKEEAAMIAEVAKKKEIFILSDEVYSKLIYDGEHQSPAVADKCQERTVILNSLSKAYAMTGWRVGYLVGPAELIKKISILVRNTLFSLPVFIQRAAISALGGDQRGLRAMVQEYKKRRDMLVDGLNQIPGVSCEKPKGALYVFPNISKTGLTSREFVKLMLEKAGVFFSPGTDFGSAGEGYVRGSFSVSVEDIQEGLRRMKEALLKK